MRPEKRIDIFLEILGKKWKEQGVDLRFAQFMVNNGLANMDRLYHFEENELLSNFFPDVAKREYTLWGTYGKDGTDPLTHKPIKDLTTDHLQAILDNIKNLDPQYKEVITNELQERTKEE